MAILKHIAAASAFKVGLVAYGIIGLILGALCTAVAAAAFAGMHVAHHAHAHMPFPGHIGIIAIVICPIVYGLIGGIGAAIGAALYNVASKWVGGIEVDISQV